MQKVGVSALKLINLVKEHPVLYDTKHELYKRTDIKDRTWRMISEVMGIEETIIRSAWRSMRDTFQKNWKYLSEHPNPDERKRYKYYKPLLFLANYSRKNAWSTTPISNVGCETLDESVLSLEDDDDDDDPLNEQREYLSESEYTEIELNVRGKSKLHLNEEEIHVKSELSYAENNNKQPKTTRRMPISPSTTRDSGFNLKKRKFSGEEAKPTKSQADSKDSIDYFFLNMASIVKEYNLNISDLAKLQCKLLNITTIELEKFKNNVEQK